MKRHSFKTGRAGLALAAALALLLALTPMALADSLDVGTDRIEISDTGAVTLVSSHLAEERVSSVEFALKTEGEASFSFAPDIVAGWLTNCVAADGTLHVYIAGVAPLMEPGYTSRVLGSVTDPQAVQPMDDSIKYVYGRRTITVNAPGEEPLPGDENTARGRLENALAGMADKFGAAHGYTEETWAKLNDAIDAANRLLEREDASDEELTAALEALDQAIKDLQNAGMADLAALLGDARTMLSAARYTPDSYADLEAAIRNGEAVAAKGDGASDEEITAAVTALRAAMNGLVEYQDADSNGGVHSDGYDPGGSGGSGGSTGDSGGDGGSTSPRSAQPPADMPQNDAAPEQAPAPTDAAAPETVSASATPAPTFMPSERAPGAAPDTGDGTALLPWIVMFGLCAAALTALLRRRGENGRS